MEHVPSWAVVATADKAAGTDITRSMAERAGAAITEVDESHLVMVSQPQAVTDVILEAVTAAQRVAVGARPDPRLAVRLLFSAIAAARGCRVMLVPVDKGSLTGLGKSDDDQRTTKPKAARAPERTRRDRPAAD